VQVLLDIETRDPDDVVALCLAATHPAVRLAGVTVNPGTGEQIGLVREVLGRLGVEVPLGSRVERPTGAVSPFLREWLGEPAPTRPDEVAHELLARALGEAEPGAVLLTTAPLHNLRLLLRHHPGVSIRRWVAQGGFAGDNLVHPRHRLAKFAGRESCESFNFGHDPAGARAALASGRIGDRRLVSKNVTHGVAWDAALQARVAQLDDPPAGVGLAAEGMGLYLRRWPEGKLLHDPLALAAVVDPGAFAWVEAEVYGEHGRWGSRPATGTGTFVSVAVDAARALAALLGETPATTGRTP
jgi:pyrimidine-specific ribonucleoside hydrolase